jgi:hypothetical protein
MRRSSTYIGAVAISLAAAASGVIALAAPAGAASTAASDYAAAIKAAGSQGVHFVSTATESGTSIKVVGDTGATSGAQTLVVKKGTLTENVSVLLVGATGYVKGNPTALINILGLTAAQSKTYNEKWLSFPTSNTNLAELVSGLHNKDVSTELKMTGPFSFGASTTISGQSAKAIKGKVASSTGTSVPVVLYIAASGTPRPLEEVTNPAKSNSKTAIHGTVVFTNWGEKTNEKSPAKSSSLLALIPPTTTTTTAAPAAG